MLKSLFKVKNNPQLDKDYFTFSKSSKYPYFTRTVFNNGIYGLVDYLDDDHLIKGNAIAVGMMGMQFFFMQSDFYAGQFTKTLYPLFEGFDEDIALYFISILNLFQARLKGELVRNFEGFLLSQKIPLPVCNSKIDFAFMRRYIATLKAERVATLKIYLQASGLQNTVLTAKEQEALDTLSNNKSLYATFLIEDLFDIEKGKRLTKADMKPGNLNYIGAISSNNGIRQKISSGTIWQPNCITVNYNGSVGCSYYQDEPFHASDDVNVLYLKDNILNRNSALYFCSLLYKRSRQFSYSEKWNLARMLKTDISVPVKQNGCVDYDFMENLISAEIKLCIDRLMSEKDLEISLTEKEISAKTDAHAQTLKNKD